MRRDDRRRRLDPLRRRREHVNGAPRRAAEHLDVAAPGERLHHLPRLGAERDHLVEQPRRPRERAAGHGAHPRGDEAPAALGRLGAQPCGGLERLAGGRVRRPCPRPLGGVLEGGRHALVRAGRRQRQVPCAAVEGAGVAERLRRGGVRAMGGPPVGGVRPLVDRRADEGVGEGHPRRAHEHHAGPLGGLQVGHGEPLARERPRQQLRRSVVGARQQERPARRRRQRREGPQQGRAEVPPDRQRVGQRRAPGELVGAQRAGELDERERVPARPGGQRGEHPGVGRRPEAACTSSRDASASARPRRRRRGTVLSSSGALMPSRPAMTIAMPSATSRRAEKRSASSDSESSQWASSTRHSTGRSSAAAASRRSVATYAAKRSPGGRRPERQRAAQRLGLRGGKLVDVVEDRRQEVGEPGERQARLPLGAGGLEDAERPSRGSRACRSSAVLPIPGSPETRRAPLMPRAAPSTSASTSATSRARPIIVRRSPARTRSPGASVFPPGGVREGVPPAVRRRRQQRYG